MSGAVTIERAKVGLAHVVLLRVLVMAIPLARQSYSELAQNIGPRFHDVVSSTFEERRQAAYESGGYEYLSQVLPLMPDPNSLPRIVYSDWPHATERMIPGFRGQPENRVVLALGVGLEATREQALGNATRIGNMADGLERWAFIPIHDAELLTEFRLFFPSASGAAATLHVRLLNSESNPTVRGEWDVPVPAGTHGSLSFKLPTPLSHFSFFRDSVPFILELRATPMNQTPAAIALIGVRVAIDGFEVVDQGPRGFVAIQSDLAADARIHPEGQWAAFIRKLESAQGNR